MYLSKKVMEETIETATGKEVLPIVRALKDKKNVSEFKLANSLRKDINETRNMLYKLSNLNLVSATRKKDKKKGWYVYYWTLNNNNMRHLAQKSKEAYLKRLTHLLEHEKQGDFYSCGNKCTRILFEQAMEMNFRCIECGNLLEHSDNSHTIEEIEQQIKEIKSKIK